MSFTVSEFKNLTTNALPNGWGGAFAAIPFPIWFFLAIEGVANVAEEAKNPQRNILIGFGSAIFTLVILCILTFTSAVGVDGWEAIVYPPGNTELSDSPLALAKILGKSNILYYTLIRVGLFGLVASFHGIILVAGRSALELGRERSISPFVGKVNTKTKTPINALIVNMGIGILALLTGKTGEIIIIACFGALTLYIVSMINFFALRKNHPDLERPFRVPLFPYFPTIALVIAVVAMIEMSIQNLTIMAFFWGLMASGYMSFRWYQREL
jgi:ethanolamine permease